MHREYVFKRRTLVDRAQGASVTHQTLSAKRTVIAVA
jgi:hypothetical protein